MMKVTVRNSKAKLKNLEQFICSEVTGHRTSFEVSRVKRDGKVYVRFRSLPGHDSQSLATDFVRALLARKVDHQRYDGNKFLVSLSAF